MTRTELVRAGEQLERAAEGADGEDREQLADLADQLAQLAERETAPDHGRLARIQNHANDIQDTLDGDGVTAIDEAKDHINAFRETIEGV